MIIDFSNLVNKFMKICSQAELHQSARNSINFLSNSNRRAITVNTNDYCLCIEFWGFCVLSENQIVFPLILITSENKSCIKWNLVFQSVQTTTLRLFRSQMQFYNFFSFPNFIIHSLEERGKHTHKIIWLWFNLKLEQKLVSN